MSYGYAHNNTIVISVCDYTLKLVQQMTKAHEAWSILVNQETKNYTRIQTHRSSKWPPQTKSWTKKCWTILTSPNFTCTFGQDPCSQWL